MEENHTVFVKGPPIKATAKMTIKDFVEVITTSKEGQSYHSENFMVGNTPMAIWVYPNGNNDEHKGNVSIFLASTSEADVTLHG